MRILHVMDSGGVYGAEILVLGLMEAQERAGAEPILASIGTRRDATVPGKPVEVEAEARGLRVERFRFLSGPNPFGALRLLRFARRVRADVLHVHGYKGDILLGLLPRGMRPVPIVATVHGWTGTGQRSKLALYEWLDAKVLGRVDAIAVVHEGMLAHPRLAGRGLSIQCVENGLPPTRAQGALPDDDPVRAFAGAAFTVGTVGRLSPEKGFDVLIEAFGALGSSGNGTQAFGTLGSSGNGTQAFGTLAPDGGASQAPRLVLVGEGPERAALEAKVRALGLEARVRFAGYRADARRVLEAFSVFVLPSHTEGLPMTVLEAMEAAVPVVASAVGGIPKVLDGGRAGLLVEPGRVDRLAAAIERVRKGGEEVRALVSAARARVREHYSMDRCARDYEALYRSVMMARGAAKE